MLGDKPKPAWIQILITALITAFLSLAVGILLHQYTSKTADLIYEVFPPAHFDKQTTRISIYNARLENAGRKEAEEVNVYFELPTSCHIQDIKVEPTLKSIAYNVTSPQSHARMVSFPLLNPGDSCRFSVLVDQGEIGSMKVEVRGKGLTGHVGPSNKSSDVATVLSVSASILAVLGLLVGISPRCGPNSGVNARLMISSIRKGTDWTKKFSSSVLKVSNQIQSRACYLVPSIGFSSTQRCQGYQKRSLCVLERMEKFWKVRTRTSHLGELGTISWNWLTQRKKFTVVSITVRATADSIRPTIQTVAQ